MATLIEISPCRAHVQSGLKKSISGCKILHDLCADVCEINYQKFAMSLTAKSASNCSIKMNSLRSAEMHIR